MPRVPSAILTTTMLAAWSASALAQGLGFSKPPSVTVAPIAAVAVTPGKSAKVEIAVRVDQGFHINSHQPRDQYLVPTALRLDPPTNLVIRGVTYPPGQDQTFDFMPGESLNVYTGDVSISAMVYAAGNAARGTFRVHGALKYQACDNRQCYPPKEVPVEFDVNVARAASGGGGHRNTPQSPNVR